MDPNHWSNYNQAYGRLGAGALPTSHGAINRIDFPLLEQPGLGSGLALSPSLQSHASLGSRPLGTLPAVNYAGHPLHSTMSQFLDPINTLQATFPGQSPYKTMSMGQNPFPFDTPGRSSAELPVTYSAARYSAGTPTGLSSHSKSLFGAELHAAKEIPSIYSSSLAPQGSGSDTSPKGWGLSNFVPAPSTPFGNLSTDPLASDFTPTQLSQSQPAPPPAHSSGSRMSTIQRNPYSVDELFNQNPRSVKSSQSIQGLLSQGPVSYSISGLGRAPDPILLSKSTHQSFSSSPNEIEDLSSHSQSQQLYSTYNMASTTYTTMASDNPIYSSSQLPADMNYDPVSPATPLSDTAQGGDNPFSTVSLQDLASLGSSTSSVPDKPHPRDTGHKQRESVLMQDTSHIVMHSSIDKSERISREPNHIQNLPAQMTMQQTPPGMHNGQNPQSVHSPMQQSPISVGSPQMPMSMGSPQNPMPSSTVVQAPPPVQAMADSTTKPKRGGRGRRKKSELQGGNTTGINQSQTYIGEIPQHSQMFPGDMQHQQQAFPSEMGHPSQNYRMDNQPNINQQYIHPSELSSMVEPAIAPNMPRSVPNSQLPERLQRSPLEESLASMQHRLQSMSDDLLSRHSSVSSLSETVNSVHQPSPMQDPLSMSHQPNYSEALVGGQHSSPLADPSPPNQVSMESMIENSHIARNTDSASLTSHSDSPLDQRQPVLNNVQEPDTVLGAPVDPNHYNMNSFDGPFMEQLTDGPHHSQIQSFSSAEPLPDRTDVMSDRTDLMSPDIHNQSNSFQDAINESMHLSGFGNPFHMPPEQQQHLQVPDVDPSGSTIDEATFSSLFGSAPREPDKAKRSRTKAEQKMMPIVTVTPKVYEDDELCHLAEPPPSIIDPPVMVSKEETRRKSFGHSFQDSFLNYLMGKKQETLESLSSITIHKKPQLPKYIPEPRRTVAASSEASKKKNPKRGRVEDSDDSDEGSFDSSSGVEFSDSDEEEAGSNFSKAVASVLCNLSEDDCGEAPVRCKSKDLTLRISLPSSKKSPRGGGAKGRGRGGRGKGSRGGSSRSRSKGSFEQDSLKNPLSSGDEQSENIQKQEEVPVVPLRSMIYRRAKEKALEKSTRKKKKISDSVTERYQDSDASSLSSEEGLKKSSTDMEGSEKDYDSDKDPAWTPFVVDIKQPGYDEIDSRPRRQRRASRGRGARSGRGRGARRPTAEMHVPPDPPDSPAPKLAKFSALGSESEEKKDDKEEASKDEEEETSCDSKSGEDKGSAGEDSEHFQVGRFIIEKKDLHNYESYPVWKIEQGRMIHKYEILLENGKILHKAVSTYSSWMPTMKDQFVPIRVKVVYQRDFKEVIEVLEEYRPKPPTDGSLETKYEDDPLVDLFNVYLQIFLSQALESGFLSAITESQDNFYMTALEKIDKLIVKKLEEIDKKIKWKPYFKECLKLKPQLREIDRPNLKQSCQACENSSPPTIKSIHFLGLPYDRFDLEELRDTGDVPATSEFMIGKTAAQFVAIYHSLYHFKFNLYKRCLAKVNLVRDSNENMGNETILDQCLQNRAWVLKIFEDLKRMLEKS